jgi:XTP/dITP diphosphohydrolase
LVAIGEMQGHLLMHQLVKTGLVMTQFLCRRGFEISTAQMSAAEKDAISHRGKALNDLAIQISEVISKL